MSILRNGLLPSISGKTDKFRELLDLHYIDHVPFVEISKKIGVPSATLHRWIRTFEHETPELSALMRKNGKRNHPIRLQVSSGGNIQTKERVGRRTSSRRLL